MGLNKVKGCFHQETLFPLLFELISRLASDSPDAVCLVPLDSIVNTLAILEVSKSSMALIFPVSNRLWEDETVFRMVMENGPTDLLVACKYAIYSPVYDPNEVLSRFCSICIGCSSSSKLRTPAIRRSLELFARCTLTYSYTPLPRGRRTTRSTCQFNRLPSPLFHVEVCG